MIGKIALCVVLIVVMVVSEENDDMKLFYNTFCEHIGTAELRQRYIKCMAEKGPDFAKEGTKMCKKEIGEEATPELEYLEKVCNKEQKELGKKMWHCNIDVVAKAMEKDVEAFTKYIDYNDCMEQAK